VATQDRRAVEVVAEVLDDGHGFRVGPMEILQHEQPAAGRAQRAQEPDHRLAAHGRRQLGAGGPDRGHQTRECRHPRLQFVGPESDVDVKGRQRFGQRSERAGARAGHCPTPHDQQSPLAGDGRDLVHQT
jgi:hypothetical protein